MTDCKAGFFTAIQNLFEVAFIRNSGILVKLYLFGAFCVYREPEILVSWAVALHKTNLKDKSFV